MQFFIREKVHPIFISLHLESLNFDLYTEDIYSIQK